MHVLFVRSKCKVLIGYKNVSIENPNSIYIEGNSSLIHLKFYAQKKKKTHHEFLHCIPTISLF